MADDLLTKLKEFEAQASTVLGVAEGAVVTPAKELAKKIRDLVAELTPKDDEPDDGDAT